MNDQQRLDLITGEMTDLFELKRGLMGYTNCPTFAYTGKTKGAWVTVPFRKKLMRLPAQAGYDCMCQRLGVEKQFSVAASPRSFNNTRWLSLEWDMDGLTPDEMFVKSAANNDMRSILQKWITPHWKFTGNRSVHLDIFLEKPVSHTVGSRLLKSLGGLFPSGHADKINLTQCMRLPLSRHQSTDGLCRYAGCHSPDDVASYLKLIKRDDVSNASITALCEQLESLCACDTPTAVTTTIPPIPGNTYGIGGVVSRTLVTEVTQPTPEQWELWERKLKQSNYLKLHPRREEFLGYLHNGIPQGMLNQLLFEDKAPFTLFVTAMVGSRDDAHAFMRYLASVNVSDEAQLQNRLGRVDYLYETCFQRWTDCDTSFVPVEQLHAFEWLTDFVHAMDKRFMEHFGSRRLVNNLVQVLQYSLLLLYRHPEGATIAVADVSRKLGLSKKTAVKHLQLLRSEFPVLRVKEHHNHLAHRATDYILNEEYVQSVLGYLIKDDFAIAA